MTINRKWLVEGANVITSEGTGVIVDVNCPDVMVKINVPIMPKREVIRIPEESISLLSNYLVIRILMIRGAMVINGFYTLDKESGLEYINSSPYAEDETLLLVDLKDASFVSNRHLGILGNEGYGLLTGYLDRHNIEEYHQLNRYYEEYQESEVDWVKIEKTGGVTGGIFFAAWIDYGNCKVLGYALLAAMNVVRRERF